MKILLADDHDLVREGLMLALQRLNDSVSVLEANDTTEALRLAEQHEDIDIVILDISMPGMNRLEGLDQMQKIRPDTPVVLLTAHEDASLMQDALSHGAQAYILKSLPTEELLDALRLVFSGGIYIPSMLLNGDKSNNIDIKDTNDNPPSVDSHSKKVELTNRQTQILSYLMQGNTNKEIARSLSISEATVRTHVSLLFQRLNVRNRTEAGHVAMQLGLLQVP